MSGASDFLVCRQVEQIVQHGVPHALCCPHADKGNRDGAAEDESEARVPIAEDIQKGLNAGRVQHAGK